MNEEQISSILALNYHTTINKTKNNQRKISISCEEHFSTRWHGTVWALSAGTSSSCKII